MHWTRREFLRSSLIGAAALSLTQEGFARNLLFRYADLDGANDARLLDELQRASFGFFWSECDPKTGLIRDRALASGEDGRRMSSIAATGFGLTAMCIAHRRKYMSGDAIAERVRQTLRFLAVDAPHVHGFLYHYSDLRDGTRFAGSEISPIDMAILLCGVLTCRAYFQDQRIREDATRLYERVEWPWMLDGGNTLALSWTPELGFNRLRWDSFSECTMLYLLAIGSPTHPISPLCWRAVGRPWLVYQHYRFISSPAPLFVHQFPQAWFDFRGKRDEYTNYFENSVEAVRGIGNSAWTLSHSSVAMGQICGESPRQIPARGMLPGVVRRYKALLMAPLFRLLQQGRCLFCSGNLLPCYVTCSHQYGELVWKRYGFVDAFNPLTGWVDRDVVGIDVGISLLMAENARSQFVWETFMRNRETHIAMQRCGFHSHFQL